MGRSPRVAIVFACLATSTALLCGCSGKKSTTVATSAGNVTVEQNSNGQTTTVKSSQGEMRLGKGAVDPATLGLPIYPGAKQSDESSISMSTLAKGRGGQVVMLTTEDTFDKVYDYYKSQLPAGSEKMKVASGGSQVATFQVGESGAKELKTVMLAQSNGKVTIQLVHSLNQ